MALQLIGFKVHTPDIKALLFHIAAFSTLPFIPGNARAQVANRNATSKPINITLSDLDRTRQQSKVTKAANATYLALAFGFNEIDSVECIYSEIRIPNGEAPLHTYYCVVQGNGYYCGLQTNSKKERRIIFSAWDSKFIKKKDRTSEGQKASIIAASPNLIINRFYNEGSGIQTHIKYQWEEDSTYKFLIRSIPDSASNTTLITLYVGINDKWQLIAKLKRPVYNGYEKGFVSFLEDFSSKGRKHRRGASYQNQWVAKANGEWVELTRSYFYLPFGDGNKEIKDYGCALFDNKGFFMVSGGGYTGAYLPTPIWLHRKQQHIIPLSKLPD